MGTAAFQQGAGIYINNKEFVLLRKFDENHWQIEETRTKRIHEKSDIDLRKLYVDGALRFNVKEDDAPIDRKGLSIGKPNLHIQPAEMEAAKIRRSYGLAAMDVPNTEEHLKAVSCKIWVKLGKPAVPPHWVSVYRWKTNLNISRKSVGGPARWDVVIGI